jgi:hypothetical protein
MEVIPGLNSPRGNRPRCGSIQTLHFSRTAAN